MSANESQDAKQQMICYTLGKSVFGSELNPSDLLEFAKICTLRSMQKDEYLFHQGDPAKYFFIVHQGSIKVHKLMPDGREQVINIFKTWQSFAEVALSGFTQYPVSAVAMESSQVLCVDCIKLSKLLQEIPELSLRIIASMSLRLKFLVGKLESQSFQQADARLAAWILEHMTQGKNPFVEITLKKKNIAAQLGITSETFSRNLNHFKKSGWIQEVDKTWVIQDLESIENCATN